MTRRSVLAAGVVKELLGLVEKARADIGDSLTGHAGSGVRVRFKER